MGQLKGPECQEIKVDLMQWLLTPRREGQRSGARRHSQGTSVGGDGRELHFPLDTTQEPERPGSGPA